MHLESLNKTNKDGQEQPELQKEMRSEASPNGQRMQENEKTIEQEKETKKREEIQEGRKKSVNDYEFGRVVGEGSFGQVSLLFLSSTLFS